MLLTLWISTMETYDDCQLKPDLYCHTSTKQLTNLRYPCCLLCGLPGGCGPLMVIRGVMTGRKGGTVPRAPDHYRGAEPLREREIMSAGNRKIWTILQVLPSIQPCPSERPQVRTWGHQTCFLPRGPSNLVTPLMAISKNYASWNRLRNFWKASHPS